MSALARVPWVNDRRLLLRSLGPASLPVESMGVCDMTETAREDATTH